MESKRVFYPKRPFWSVPNTTNNSPDLSRKFDNPLRDPPIRTPEGFTRVAVSEEEDVAATTPSCDVTVECFLFLVMTSLTVLIMMAAMTVLVLHFVSGGKIFVKNRDAGKNFTTGYRHPFNFKN